ncbi:MAG: hypothetical protein ACSHXB_14865 [Sulfitobacter sp.]
MGNPVDAKQGGVADSTGSSASSKVSANTRVKTASGAIGIQTDVPTFSGTTVSGVWTLGTLRCKVNGVPMITSTAVGIGIASATPPGTTGPLQLQKSDSNVKAL